MTKAVVERASIDACLGDVRMLLNCLTVIQVGEHGKLVKAITQRTKCV